MKLPINQILYVAIFGLLGGSGWKFYETWKQIRKEEARAKQRLTEASERCVEEIEKGRSLNVVAKGPNYAENSPWEHFKTANLIGKEPPPPPKPIDEDQPKEPVEKQETPLEDICSIVCLVYEGPKSLAIVRYRETANVQPPEDVVDARNSARMAPATPPRNNRSNRRRNNRAKTPVTMPRVSDGFIHILQLEDNLWPPYEHIKLVAVDDNAEFAEFSRSESGAEESEPEKFFRDELDLSQELLRKLHEAGIANAKPRPIEKPEDAPDGPFSGFGSKDWKGGEATKRVNGDYHIGRVDWKDWGDDPNRIFNSELRTKTYTGRSGIAGVQVSKVSPRFQQFGVQSGDVVVSINGESVKSKAQAITVAKRFYKRGVRTFNVVFLSKGREVTRTYVAPNQGR